MQYPFSDGQVIVMEGSVENGKQWWLLWWKEGKYDVQGQGKKSWHRMKLDPASWVRRLCVLSHEEWACCECETPSSKRCFSKRRNK